MEKRLDSFDRKKREVSNHFLKLDSAPIQNDEDDEVADDDDDNEVPDSGASTLTTDSAFLQDIKLPLKAGSPAFKIIASKVYILYPSMFQDPNIFGRFSIPQSINMDEKSDMSATKEILSPPTSGPLISAPSASSLSHPYNQNQQKKPYQPQPGLKKQPQQNDPSRRMFNGGQQQHLHQYRRQLSDEPTDSSEPTVPPFNDSEQDKGIESHIRGQIVVQNQDVNEYNSKKVY